MKKISIYALGILVGASLVACDNYKEPNPPSQSNQAPHVLQASDVNVSSSLTSGTYDLQQMYDNNQTLALATVTCNVLPEGYSLSAYAFVSGDKFETSYQVPVKSSVAEDGSYHLYINPSDLEDVYYDNISPRPEVNTIGIRYYIVTVYDAQYAIVGGPTNAYGPYDLTIQPYVKGSEFLYTPGAANNWSFSGAQMLTTSDFTTYWGYAILYAEGFKFTSADNWDGINYGAGDEEGTLSDNSEAGNLTVAENGLYYCTVNLGNLTYTTSLVSTYGIIGSATPGGWDAETTLTSDNYLVWTGTMHLVPGEYKFRANDAWDINLGGTADNLTPGGDNLQFEGAEGDYVVTLDLSTLPYSCKIETK